PHAGGRRWCLSCQQTIATRLVDRLVCPWKPRRCPPPTKEQALTLYLYEIAPHHGDRSDADRVLKEVDALVHRAGGELIEAQVTGGTHRVFAIAEFALQQAVPRSEERRVGKEGRSRGCAYHYKIKGT